MRPSLVIEEITDGGNVVVTPPSLEAVILIITAFFACLSCIYMVFFFGRRVQASAYLRDSLVEGAQKQELNNLLRELHDKLVSEPLDPADPPPEGFGHHNQLWTTGIYVPYQERLAEPWEDETPDDREERLAKLKKCKEWEISERTRYSKLREELEIKAHEQAEKKIPKSMDISLLGGGWTFLLEFSTVIVIIFVLVILGILGTLEGKEISTILAAIAGYVLGKATGGAKPPQSEEPS